MIGEINNPAVNIVDGQPVIGVDGKFTLSNIGDPDRFRNLLLMQEHTYEDLCLKGLGTQIEGLRFQEIEEWKTGRERSAHGVYFGELFLNMSNGVICLPVACKPYGMFEGYMGLGEFAALERFSSSPELRSFTPTAIWYDALGAPTVITDFESQVVSLDNRDWQQDSSESLARHLDPIRALQKSAQILARLHMRGFAHRDAQIKNMAMSIEDGSIRLTDLTTLSRVHKPDDPDYELWVRGVEYDLQILLTSIRREGYLNRDHPTDVRDMLKIAVLDIHSSMLRHPSCRTHISLEMSQVIDDIGHRVLNTVCRRAS